jgi:hypothetical protein
MIGSTGQPCIPPRNPTRRLRPPEAASSGRPVHVGSGEAAVIVEFGQRDPSLAQLTLNKSFGGFALCLERVKILIETFFRRFVGIEWRSAGERPMASANSDYSAA